MLNRLLCQQLLGVFLLDISVRQISSSGISIFTWIFFFKKKRNSAANKIRGSYFYVKFNVYFIIYLSIFQLKRNLLMDFEH
ncbi:hypothetical protein BY996DRAFT_388431 [Phakopsora pachyrhizi]|nr:hypothetical protein BY996DRAFT_388431 [Phakopsora pachyrhizi]